MTKLHFLLKRIASKLWVKPTLMSLAAIGWVAIAYFGQRLDRGNWPIDIDRETLLNLFGILASTMLTVATFSVSAIAAAYASVASSASPRATRIVMSDRQVQSTLAAFLATFIYAVIAITALSAVPFGPSGRFLLFCGFVGLVGWVLVSFLRWVDRVSRLGRLGDTIERVSQVARELFDDPQRLGCFGARSASGLPAAGRAIPARRFGYVQHVDVERLQAIAAEIDGQVSLAVRPGSFLVRGMRLAVVSSMKDPPDDLEERIAQAISVGPDRWIDTDPRFALILLGEIADRALSPAVNDPGTAIAILTVDVELLAQWAQHDLAGRTQQEITFERVSIPPLAVEDLVQDAFTPLIRDGAGIFEVGVRLQKTLWALTQVGHDGLADAARQAARMALDAAQTALQPPQHLQALRDVARTCGVESPTS